MGECHNVRREYRRKGHMANEDPSETGEGMV